MEGKELMMGFESLMIGDYVQYGDIHPFKTRVLGISSVDHGKHWHIDVEPENPNGMRTVPMRAVKPISLTTEMLEKNGFEKTLDEDDMECYRYYNRAADGYIKITLYDNEDGSWNIEIVNYDKFNDNEIRYKNEFSFLKVHELQHALRLCEINKEIKL